MQRENLIVWKHSFSSSDHRVEGGSDFSRQCPPLPARAGTAELWGENKEEIGCSLYKTTELECQRTPPMKTVSCVTTNSDL